MQLDVVDNLEKSEIGMALYHRLWAVTAVAADPGRDTGAHAKETADRIVRIIARLYDMEEERVDRVGTSQHQRSS